MWLGVTSTRLQDYGNRRSGGKIVKFDKIFGSFPIKMSVKPLTFLLTRRIVFVARCNWSAVDTDGISIRNRHGGGSGMDCGNCVKKRGMFLTGNLGKTGLSTTVPQKTNPMAHWRKGAKKKSRVPQLRYPAGCITGENQLQARYRKVTICARLHSRSGLKVVAEVPLVMLFSTAHRTASV